MIAAVHATAIVQSTGGRLVAVASRKRESASAFAARHGDARVCDSVEELAADPQVDVVCIATPSGAHLEPALVAAEARKHILVEKPLEISTARVDAMIEACRNNRVRLAAVFQSRFGRGAQRVKQAAERGRFGRLALCSAYVKWHRAASYYQEGGWKGTRRWDGGGALMNQGIHAVDLLLWIAGPAARVSAMAGVRAHTDIEVEDTAAACLEFANGSYGVIEASTAIWPGEARRIEICGSQGSAVLVDDRIVRWDFAEPDENDKHVLEEFGQSTALRSGAANASQIDSEGHRLQVQNLIDALTDNSPLAICGSEARKAVEVIEAIYRSVEARASVTLPLQTDL